MRYGTLPGAAKQVSRIVFGTDNLRSSSVEWRIPFSSGRSLAMLDEVFALGINTFDTAAMYGSAESILGKWMSSRRRREQTFIITKGGYRSVLTPFSGVSARGIARDLHRSLRRLRTDYLDLYLLHYDDPQVPIEVIVDILDGMRAAGKIREYGFSNVELSRIRQAHAYALGSGKRPCAAVSPQFSLIEWARPFWPGAVTLSGPAGAEGRAWYRETGIAVLSYSSLSRGFFRPERQRVIAGHAQAMAAGDGAGAVAKRNLEKLSRVRQLAERLGASPAQIALAYLFHQELNLFAIVGSRNMKHLAEDCAAVDVQLSAADVTWLEAHSAS